MSLHGRPSILVRQSWRAALTVAIALAAGGCVAAAIPLAAGGAMLKRNGTAPAAEAASASESSRHVDIGEVKIALTPLTALPPPSPASSGSTTAGYAAFVDFALASVSGDKIRSVIVDPRAIGSGGAMRTCPEQDPAVLLDLDPGVVSFDPAEPGLAQPDLTQALARLRAAGIVILWQSALDVGHSAAIYRALAISGLDPAGTDRLLLLSDQEQSKQDRRQAAARYNCIVAIAGDRRGDFDELYDYLKDPGQPLPIDATIGRGWFLVPPPLAYAAAKE